MSAIISIIIILICIFLILAVLVQNPKGGGLASGFSGGSQVIGVRRTADFLEKATWVLACALLLFSIASTVNTGKGKSTSSVGQTSQTKANASKFNKTGNGNATQSNFPGIQPTQAPGNAPAGTPTATPPKPHG